MNKYIHQYIKNGKGTYIGCVASTDAGRVGWSKCNYKAGDTFNKYTALQIAVGRANLNPVSNETISTIPSRIKKVVIKFKNDRSVRYFKQTA